MFAKRRINRESEAEVEVRKDVNAKGEVSVVVVNKQIPCRQRTPESVAIGGKEKRRAFAVEHAEAGAEHKIFVKQVTVKVVVKVQLSQIRVQVVLREDEKLSDNVERQAEVKRVVPAVNEIRKRFTAEQLQEPRAKTKLRTRQPQPPAVPVLPAAYVRRVLRGRNGPRPHPGQCVHE